MGGDEVDPGVFDYSIVYIKVRDEKKNKTYGCTGTMISKRHLLTCLHCVQDDNQTFYTHFTFDTIFDKDTVFNITDFNIHIIDDRVDLAIIEFSKNTKFKHKNMHKMHLVADNMLAPHLQDKIHNKGYIAGYGHYKFQDDKRLAAEFPVSDGRLRIARVPIYPKKVCRSNVRICSSDGKLPFAYHGDSGGPLFFFDNQMSNKTKESERDELDFNITHPKRHHKMYQFGLIFGGEINRTYSLPIHQYCWWIEEVTRWEVQCEYVFQNRGISVSPPPQKAAENGSPNFQPFENDKNIKDSDISLKSDTSKVLPLPDLPKNEFEDEENEMDAEDLSCILFCINILILIGLVILLCYYFCLKTAESNVQLPTVIQKV
uniref:Peptidase S1 domain-containing protein n=1 Tax=Panagrolaimus davidi TaxID=227884 RepID=A0A914P1F0_9BILA